MSNHTNTSDIPLLTTPFLHYIPTSPPSQPLDFHLPSRTPLHGISISEWAGAKPIKQNNLNSYQPTLNTSITINNRSAKPIVLKESSEDNWKDVYTNIKCMDQLYDASFYSWLKSEENVLVTAMYLHRIANEYPLVRIINALKWLISDWRLESISTLVRHVTVDWSDETGDLRRAHLLRHLTQNWATQYTTTLITMVLSSAPYTNATHHQRERFLRAFTKEWDFSKLSEFFMYLQSPANIDYKVKCIMLQEAARRERETLGAKLKKQKKRVSPKQPEPAPTEDSRRHHRRTSSNDVNDIKRLRLSTPDLATDHSESTVEPYQEEGSSSSSSSTDVFHGFHLRRRSSSNASHESIPEDSTKKKNSLTHFTTSDETF